jgi:adhesin transport system outer membrane protein
VQNKKLIISFAFLTFSSGAFSAIQTYGQALELALENNPALARTYFDFAASRERVAVVEGELKPSLDIQAVRGREDRKTPTNDFGMYNKSDVRFTATQLLFDGFQTLDRVKAADFEARRDLQGHIRESESAALEVTKAYLSVALFQRLKDFADQNYYVHRQVESRVSDRVSGGVSAGVDLEQVTARLALAESNVLTEAANLHDTIAELQRLTGERVASGRLPFPVLLPELTGGSRAEVLRRALDNSPRVRQSTEEMLAVSAERDAARGPFFPRIDLRYRNEQSTNLQDVRGDFDTEAIELVFNFNFYRGGADEAQRRERNHRYYAAMEARKQACWDTRREVLVAYNDAQVLERQIEFLSAQLASQRLARIAYEDEFDLGSRSLLDLLDSQNELFDTQRALIRAETGLISARATALAEAGSLLSSFGVSMTRPDAADWQWDPSLSAAYAECPAAPTEGVDVDFEGIYDRLRDSLGS